MAHITCTKTRLYPVRGCPKTLLLACSSVVAYARTISVTRTSPKRSATTYPKHRVDRPCPPCNLTTCLLTTASTFTWANGMRVASTFLKWRDCNGAGCAASRSYPDRFSGQREINPAQTNLAKRSVCQFHADRERNWRDRHRPCLAGAIGRRNPAAGQWLHVLCATGRPARATGKLGHETCTRHHPKL